MIVSIISSRSRAILRAYGGGCYDLTIKPYVSRLNSTRLRGTGAALLQSPAPRARPPSTQHRRAPSSLRPTYGRHGGHHATLPVRLTTRLDVDRNTQLRVRCSPSRPDSCGLVLTSTHLKSAPDVGIDAFVRARLHLKSAPGVGIDACARARLAAPSLQSATTTNPPWFGPGLPPGPRAPWRTPRWRRAH